MEEIKKESEGFGQVLGRLRRIYRDSGGFLQAVVTQVNVNE